MSLQDRENEALVERVDKGPYIGFLWKMVGCIIWAFFWAQSIRYRRINPGTARFSTGPGQSFYSGDKPSLVVFIPALLGRSRLGLLFSSTPKFPNFF